MTSELASLLDSRVDQLPDNVLHALRLLTFCEPLDLDTLSGIAGVEAVEDAENRGLIRVAEEHNGIDVRFNHPLFGEVIRRRLGMAAARRLRGEVVRAHAGPSAARADGSNSAGGVDPRQRSVTRGRPAGVRRAGRHRADQRDTRRTVGARSGEPRRRAGGQRAAGALAAVAGQLRGSRGDAQRIRSQPDERTRARAVGFGADRQPALVDGRRRGCRRSAGPVVRQGRSPRPQVGRRRRRLGVTIVREPTRRGRRPFRAGARLPRMRLRPPSNGRYSAARWRWR